MNLCVYKKKQITINIRATENKIKNKRNICREKKNLKLRRVKNLI